MATYPNARRNKFSDTLYRPNDIKPLDGEVLVDDGADMRTEQRMQELKKVLGKARQEMSGSDSMGGGRGGDLVGNESIYNGKMDAKSVADRQGKFRNLLMGVGQGGTVPATKRDPINEALASPAGKHPALLVDTRGSDLIRGGQGGDVISGSSADINKSLAAQNQQAPKSVYEQLGITPALGSVGPIQFGPSSSGTDVIARFGPAQQEPQAASESFESKLPSRDRAAGYEPSADEKFAATLPPRDRVAEYNPSEASPAPDVVASREDEIRRGFAQDRANIDSAANAPRLPTAIPEGMQPDPYPLDTARRNQAYFDKVAADPNSTPQQIAEARQQMDQARNIASGYRTYGFRSSETPEQSAAINRQLAAARQPLDPAGSFNTNAERNKWDALRGSMGNDEIARAERDAKFMEQVKNGPQSQEETYWRINQRRAAAGLPPIAMPSAQETANLRGQAETNKAGVAFANQTAGLARQQQNAEAEKSYNAQRAAQGEARRLGIPPAAAAMFDPTAQPGTPAYDGNMALINPGVAIENARNSGDARRQDREDRQAAANMAVQAWKLEKERLQALMERSPPGEREAIAQQIRDGEAAAASRAMNIMLGNQPSGQSGSAPGTLTPPSPPAPPVAPTQRPAPPPGAQGGPDPNMSVNGMRLPNIRPATNKNDFIGNQAGYQPNFAALHSASGWNNDVLNSTFNDIYKPSAGPYEDTNGDGFPSFGDKGIVTKDDLQYYQGQQHAKRMLNDLMAEASNQMYSPIGALFRGKSREQLMYDGLKAKFPTYGEDAIRYAMAQALGSPLLVTDYSVWNEAVPNR